MDLSCHHIQWNDISSHELREKKVTHTHTTHTSINDSSLTLLDDTKMLNAIKILSTQKIQPANSGTTVSNFLLPQSLFYQS